MIIDVFPDILTQSDVDNYKQQADACIREFFNTRVNVLETLKAHFSQKQVESIVKDLELRKFEVTNALLVSDQIRIYKVEIDKLPRLGLILAKNLPHKVLKRIADWFMSELGKKVVLDVNIDPSILGGFLIHQEGKYNDFSLKKKLQNMADRGDLSLSTLLR